MRNMQRLSILFVLFCFLGLTSCSKASLTARLSLLKAENAYAKAYTLRTQKDAESLRQTLYHQACDNFQKTYEANPKAFTLNRIVWAADSCLRVKELERAEQFQIFEEEYTQTHPNETDHGDDAPLMGLEGQ